jgi:hypothetical protein
VGSLLTRELPYHEGEFRGVAEGLTELSSDLLTSRSNGSLSGHTSPASNRTGCDGPCGRLPRGRSETRGTSRRRALARPPSCRVPPDGRVSM